MSSLLQAVNTGGQNSVAQAPTQNSAWQELEVQLTGGNDMIFIHANLFNSWTLEQVDEIRAGYESVLDVDAMYVRDIAVGRVMLAPTVYLSQFPLLPDRHWTSPVGYMMPILLSGSVHNCDLGSTSGDPTEHVKPKKIPRPANAFILFRTANHASTVAQYPGLHNNEISFILGRKWAEATDDVKVFYKDLAEQKKREHFALHPDYVYRPRKPSEKKRRMTKKKAAALKQTEANAVTVDTILLEQTAVGEPTAAFQAASNWVDGLSSSVYRVEGQLAMQVPLSTTAKSTTVDHNRSLDTDETWKNDITALDAALLGPKEASQQLSIQFEPSAETLMANLADEAALAQADLAEFLQDRDLTGIFHPEKIFCPEAAAFEHWLSRY